MPYIGIILGLHTNENYFDEVIFLQYAFVCWFNLMFNNFECMLKSNFFLATSANPDRV